MEEGTEFLKRLTGAFKTGLSLATKNKSLPLITSCCPAWVDYMEKYYPDMVPNFSTAKSPQQMMGAMIKTYWAGKASVDPAKIFSVSVMPCTAKKFETHRDQTMYSSGYQDVDVSITTRELARMIKQAGIDLVNLPESEPDSPLGPYTGAGAIFGATGGVMEAALRTAYALVTGEELKFVEFTAVRGLQGIKEASVHIGGHGLRYKDVEAVIARGEELAPNWLDLVPEFDYPQEDCLYVFARAPETGLNLETPAEKGPAGPKSWGYRFMRLMGHGMFDNEGPLFKPMRALAEKVDGTPWARRVARAEHVAKVISSECLHCGDCALPDLAYLCVTSQCPKGERNGPCGGSRDGWCEVYPGEKQCIYVRAYDRLKPYGEEDTLGSYHIPPANYDLLYTSSWLNFFMGRDHTAKRLGVQPPEKEGKKGDAKAQSQDAKA